ncbi:MAG: IclR family transcriptional regulator [candidate division Zixibacteria bacterium]|nr:IclR family transcriptional regulator [candidate division Zixibacteria bacterium]NIU10879.1 IclR family transcriptional regulator [Phycisphaerae bacterium]NIW42355.1 helix-turn-helix domain-containing protein [candidate division Zixibacteria bacterium]NIX56694.1 helix-turn-helix domain-containing protein [candidate division Zixibacteria bacterium]
MAEKPRYSAPALEKGLDIIEYLSERDEGENLTSIASGIGRSNGEIFRMLSVLEQRGFVDRLPGSDHFLLTDKLFRLGLNRPKKKNLMKLAIPAMEKFAKECQNACHLSVRTGNEMVVVTRVESPINVGISVRVGHRLPLAHAPSGRCITAFSRPDEIKAIVADVRKSEGAKKAKEFQSAIEDIQRVGYSLMKDGFSVGITGLSAPVFDLDSQQCIAAMTSPVLHYVHLNNTDLEKIASRLRHHADTVSRLYSNHGLAPE